MKIRPYSKQELACIYFPDSLPHTAVNRLTRWIKRCPPLMAALHDKHYDKTSKIYSSRQVRLIVEYLGEP